MFPDVNRHSFFFFYRFCYGKNFDRTKTFIEKIWDKEAINKMMRITLIPDIDHLTKWLIVTDLEIKILTINKYYN